jgi:HSP20 family protein
MVNVTRYAPLDDTFDNLFRGFFVRPVNIDAQDTVARFRVDIAENDRAYSVRAELPGMKKEDITISVEGDEVAISAESKTEKDAKDVKEAGRVLRAERYFGKLYRAFSLGAPIDEASVAAKYADGILELTLPKKVAATAKRITIQ